MRRARRTLAVILAASMAAFATALEVPTEAEVLVTDSRSRIVGVGRVADGVRFDLVLEEGFAGPALLVWLPPDGGVRTIEVVIAGGAVWVDGVDLTSLLPDAFEEVRVVLAAEVGAAWPPDVGRGAPADGPGRPTEGREPPAVGDPPASPGATPGPPEAGPPDVRPPDPSPSDDPPDGPPDEGPPEDGRPSESPGPPEDPPGGRP